MQQNTTEKMINYFINTPSVGTAKVSPDLKWVVWEWANLGPCTDVYISSLTPSTSPKKLTDFGQNTHVLSWSTNSRFIIVGHDYDGDEHIRLYRVDVENGDVLTLTDPHPPHYIFGGEIHPDNKHIVYSVNYDFVEKKETEVSVVYKHNIETNKKFILAEPKKNTPAYPRLNKQGTYVAYIRSDRDPRGKQLWLVDIDGKEDREIVHVGDTEKVSSFCWHQNGEVIIFVAEAGTHRKVGMFNIHTNVMSWIIDDPARNIEEVYVLQGTDAVALDETTHGQSRVTFFDTDLIKETPFTTLQTVIPLAQLSPSMWVSFFYNSTQPGEIIIHDQSNILRSITQVFERVDYTKDDLVQAERYVWNSTDGLHIEGWLYKPQGKSIGTIIRIHGGPTVHSEDVFNMSIQYFVSQGFTVLDPNYRGSTGFGISFQKAIEKDGWGGIEQGDILSGIRSLIVDGIAEEQKIGIIGTSYGGYSAWHAITHFPKKYIAAAIPICGMTDLVVDYETTRPDLRRYSEEMMGGSPYEIPQKYQERSPINFINNIEGALFIVQGANDPNVTLENVHTVENALKKNNIEYETLIFNDEGHGIMKPKNVKILLTRSVEFFKKSFSQS